jgi:hypothetical protein
MPALDEIKQQIKAITESVTGIGKVYDRFVYAFDTKQLKDLFSDNGRINTFMFRYTVREPGGGEGNENELFVRRLWKFRFIYGYNFNDDSEKEFDSLCEKICETFNSNFFLNGSARRHSFMEIKDRYDSEYHGVLVHNAEMEMETEN